MKQCPYLAIEADYPFCAHPDIEDAIGSTTPVICEANPETCWFANHKPEPRLENGNTLPRQVALYGGY